MTRKPFAVRLRLAAVAFSALALLGGEAVLTSGPEAYAKAKQTRSVKQRAKKTSARKTSAKKTTGKASKPARGVQRGMASWYGPGFHGRRTANGERYNMNAMTAAHRTLPLGTRVRVKNLANGKVVQLRVNDRGPYAGGRVIDLSRAAARALGIKGLGRVQIEVLGDGKRKRTA